MNEFCYFENHVYTNQLYLESTHTYEYVFPEKGHTPEWQMKINGKMFEAHLKQM